MGGGATGTSGEEHFTPWAMASAGPSDQDSAGTREDSREARGPLGGLLTLVASGARPAAAAVSRCGAVLPWDPALRWPEAVSGDDGGVLGASGGWDRGGLRPPGRLESSLEHYQNWEQGGGRGSSAAVPSARRKGARRGVPCHPAVP